MAPRSRTGWLGPRKAAERSAAVGWKRGGNLQAARQKAYMSSLAPHVRDKLKARLAAATMKADLAVEAAEAAKVAAEGGADMYAHVMPVSMSADPRATPGGVAHVEMMGAQPWQETSQLSLESGAVATGNAILTDATAAAVARSALAMSQPAAASVVLDKVHVPYSVSLAPTSLLPLTRPYLLPQPSFAPAASTSRMVATGVNIAAAQVGFIKVHRVLYTNRPPQYEF